METCILDDLRSDTMFNLRIESDLVRIQRILYSSNKVLDQPNNNIHEHHQFKYHIGH